MSGQRKKAGAPPVVPPGDPLDQDTLPAPEGAARRLLWSLVRPHRRTLLLAAWWLLLQQTAVTAGPLVVAYAIDSAVPRLQRGEHLPLVWVGAGYALCALAGGAGRHRFVALTALLAQDVMLELRVRIVAHALRLSVDFHDRYTSGRLISRATTDVGTLKRLLEGGMGQIVTAALATVYISAVLLWLDWGVGVAALAVMVPLYLSMRVFRRRSIRVYRRRSSRMAAVVTAFAEHVSGIRTVQVFSRERANDRRFGMLNDLYRKDNGDAALEMARYVTSSRLVANAAVAVLVLWGAYRVAGNGLELGVYAAAVLYLRRLYDEPLKLGGVLDAYQSASASLEKIAALLAQDSSVPAPRSPRPLPAVPDAAPGRRVTFEGVRFAYRAGRDVLPGLDLTVPAGQTVAVVGPTGAGKSSLAKLLARLYDPSAGAVLLDGVDLRDLAADDLAAQVVLVPQDDLLFSGTVAENIAFGRPDAQAGEVERVARAVGAHPFITGLPGGYGTRLRGRGGQLSAGQRQLVSLARALLADPAVLILDETTSDLDIPSERAVRAALRTVLGGRTALVIAHRLSTVQIADRVLVMEAGRIVEDGSPGELMARKGQFARLHRAWLDGNSPTGETRDSR